MDRIRFRLLAALLLSLGLGLVGARVAHAGEPQKFALEDKRSPSDRTALRVFVTFFPADGRHGAYGYASLVFHNPYPARKAVSASLRESHDRLEQSFSRSLVLEPESTTRVFLPLPATNAYPSLELRGPRGFRQSQGAPTGSGADRYAVLGVQAESRTPRRSAWRTAIESATSKITRRPTTSAAQWCAPKEVPPDWRLLTGFDVIVLNAGVADLGAVQQKALARYVAGGGSLVLTGVKEVPEGPFGTMMTSLGAGGEEHPARGTGRHGFGRWKALRALHPSDDPSLVDWIADEAFDHKHPTRPVYASGIPTIFRARLEIPGLGEVPVQLFFLLILGFAIFVGPVTYLWLRRRRRLPWLTVTIPVTGFLVSLTILLYGFFSEGFGVRGSIRSYTVLDQQTHEASTAAGRTLYAGLSPSALVPAPDTMVTPAVFEREDPGAPLEVDLNAGGRISGAALPSRTPTPFATMTVGRARERLRFRHLEDGSYEVVDRPEFQAIVAPGAVVLRTFEGDLYRSDASGRLRPVRAGGPRLPPVLENELLAPLSQLPLGDDQVERPPGTRFYGYGYPSRPQLTNEGVHGFRTWFTEDTGARLGRGTYFARVKSVPSLDDLGLDVDYEAAEHLVYGILADEDIVK